MNSCPVITVSSNGAVISVNAIAMVTPAKKGAYTVILMTGGQLDFLETADEKASKAYVCNREKFVKVWRSAAASRLDQRV